MASLQHVPPERHVGFQCRSCSVANFPGRRYSCGVCPEYNLCGDCFDANLLPEVPFHLYYHPLKVHFARAAYQLYFEGDDETYSADNASLQSYKCALCEVRGLTSADLYMHIYEVHRSHSDYNEYIDLVEAYNQTERVATPAALTQGEELRENRAMAEPLSEQPWRTTAIPGLNLAQLLVHLKGLNLTSPEFPVRCVDILKRAHSLRAQQRGQEVVRTADRYVSLIEHEVAAALSERRMRVGRGASVRVVQRNGAMLVIPPSSNTTSVMRTPATPLGTSRTLFLNGLRGLDSTAGLEDFELPDVVGHGKYLQAIESSKLPKGYQDTEDHQAQNEACDKKRFLCSQFMVENKPTNRSRVGPSEQKANFVEAILCSMLADEELSPLPFKLFDVDAIKKESLQSELGNKLTIVSWKPKANETVPMPQPYMNDMLRFYKALDDYKTNTENPNTDPSTEADNSAKNNHQFSITEDALDSNDDDDDGDGSDTEANGNESASDVNPGIQDPAGSDSELLELTMASIIQGIDAIIDDDEDY